MKMVFCCFSDHVLTTELPKLHEEDGELRTMKEQMSSSGSFVVSTMSAMIKQTLAKLLSCNCVWVMGQRAETVEKCWGLLCCLLLTIEKRLLCNEMC